MKPMTSAEVRQAFIEYFEEMGHKHVPSSSLVPANDPTLLFANSGMVQFKDVFLGNEKRDYKRATTAQKSMRVSGKHNDLENVGPSPRHHTFFEMLGNFSFGDYFKRDAIRYAWDLITKVFEMPVDRLAVTVYERDDEAYDIWTKEIGLPTTRVARMSAKTNFWQMADKGPCGPCSEIFWDKQPELGEDHIVPSLQNDEDRFLEFWNLVFMQFNRKEADPTNSGQFDEPLPNPCVDTGMGLERMVMILQGGDSNYDTDVFMSIIKATQALTGDTDEQVKENYVPYRVIADHVRAAVFLISDGVNPGAKGRESVCRLVLRRAARFGKKLGFNTPFLGTVSQAVINHMGHHYTELVHKADYIKQVITTEEERFLLTLEVGLQALDEMLSKLPAAGTLNGEQAFYLKATLGLPFQVTKDICDERGFTVDEVGFMAEEDKHSLVSGGGQAMGKMESAEFYAALLKELQTEGALGADGVVYNPYTNLPATTKVIALVQEGNLVNTVLVGEKVEVVLSETHFYVEAGGQISDTGVIQGNGWIIAVEDMKKPVSGLVVHLGEVIEGNPHVGDDAKAQVGLDRRDDITRNHTGTHLLHAALRNHLGNDVHQRGSLVAPERLRFDFSYDKKVTPEELREIEVEINHAILANYPVITKVKSLDEARSEGAMALFGEKYGDTVRTVSIGDEHGRYSYELCGGVHVAETAEIGAFVFTNESSVSAGIRRVEALTGREAIQYIQAQLRVLDEISSMLGGGDNTITRLEALQTELNSAKKQVSQLQSRIAKYQFDEQIEHIETIGGKSVFIAQMNDITADTLREMADWFRNKVKENGVMVIGTDTDAKPSILVALTDDLVKQGLKAGDLIKPIAAIIGGGGGGRPNMAQAGGKDSAKLPEALAKARELLG